MLIPRTEPTNALCNIVILVVGETGAGKSYFVNKLLEVAGLQHRATIGDEVQPCTVDITHVVVPGLTSAYPALSGFQVDIVDTPGFKSSDGPASDEALFRRIETWLKENCRDAAVLGGIIYLHDISKDRLPDECQKNVASLQPFFKLGPMDKVVLVTSKWGKIYNRDFEEREKQLLKQDWAPMVTEGADVKRFKAEGTGARRVVGGNWNILPSTPNREVVTGDEAAAAKGIVDSILSRLAVSLNGGPSTPVPKAKPIASRVWGWGVGALGLGPRATDSTEPVSPTAQVPEGAKDEVAVVEESDDQVLPQKTPPMDQLPTADPQARDETASNEVVAIAVAGEPNDQEVSTKTTKLQARDEPTSEETFALAVAEAPDDQEKVPAKTPPPTAELHARDEATSNEALALGVVEASNGQEVPAKAPPPTAELQGRDEDDSKEAVALAVVEASNDQEVPAKPPLTAELQDRDEDDSNEDVALAVVEASNDREVPANTPPPTAELQARDEAVALAVAEAPEVQEVPAKSPRTTAELQARDEAATNEAVALAVVEASNDQEVPVKTPRPIVELQDKDEAASNEAVALAVVEASDDQTIARSPSINQSRSSELQARNKAAVGSSISTEPEPTNRPSDIIILVMGMAKAGKSYFISKLLKEVGSEEEVQIGYGLSPCTRQLQAFEIDGLSSDNPTLKGRRVLIVDTPGFCDETPTDYNILTGIVDWLDNSREKGDALGGAIYVHDISLDDFSRPVRENLEVFERMCGRAFLGKVVFMTTKWDRAQDGRDFKAMENKLQVGFWKGMIDGGARTMRLNDEDEGGSALHIVTDLLKHVASPDNEASLDELMQVQREVVGHKPFILAETGAGRVMQDRLAARMQALQDEPRNLAGEANSKRGKPQSKSFSRFFRGGRRFTGA